MVKDDDPIMSFYNLEIARLTCEVFNKPCFGDIMSRLDSVKDFSRDDLVTLAALIIKKIMEEECTDTEVET